MDFDGYLMALTGTPLDAKTEHTDRAALERLLNEAANAVEPQLRIQHEPKGDRLGGRPDYMVGRDARISGYVEVKSVDAPLERARRSAQIKKYQTLSGNILLTDYLEFVWLNGSEVHRARLGHSDDIRPGCKPLVDPRRAAEVAVLLRGFFSTAPQAIARGKHLAVALATRAALLRDSLATELARQDQTNERGRLFALLETFRSQIFHELTIRDFADAFGQMLAYGLFLARLNAGDTPQVRLDNVRTFIPGSFTVIRELVRFLDELNEAEYRPSKWVVEEILSIVNGIDLAAIQSDLSFRNRKAISRTVHPDDEEEQRLFERDPFIYFYEDFLKAYDPAMRKGRGVYYTPPPVVNFIVRAIDDILKSSFDIPTGLADHRRVTVLDFACGTGTFLLEIFQRVFDTIGGPEAGRADAVVREHLTKNIYGFEYLIAPYTIAHLKLSQYLKDKGHPLGGDERLQVFLTNTLEPVSPQRDFNLPELSREVEQAQTVKESPILVITGNPPYSGHSKNTGAWITSSVAEYRKGFPELSKPAQGKWLQDDYVKFIRFAQMKMMGGEYEVVDRNGAIHYVKMEGVDQGIVGVITNHSWLDNPTFKGMRKSLQDTFDQIYVFDLHGNAKKKEVAPDAAKDENVFDIEQGVAISLFIRKPGLPKGVFHADLWGKRLSKYRATTTLDLKSVNWTPLEPGNPSWLFKPQNEQLKAEYDTYPAIPHIFGAFGGPAPGFVTTHDDFAISFTAAEAKNKIKQFLQTESEAEARRLFKLCSQSQWSYAKAKKELPEIALCVSTIKATYRPFDDRWTVWDRNVNVHRRERVNNHLLVDNIALITHRTTKDAPQPFVTCNPAAHKAATRYDISYVAPLMEQGRETFSIDFRRFVDDLYERHYSPWEIFGYIYAVLSAPAYQKRYDEFLRTDFPRIPFAQESRDFDVLSMLGWELAQAHLLKFTPSSGRRLGDYIDLRSGDLRGEHRIEDVFYSPEEETIWINKDRTLGFSNLPEAVWRFQLGGYQVLDKYLKSRKDRCLNLDEQTHVGETAEALHFTINQTVHIDNAYQAAFSHLVE